MFDLVIVGGGIIGAGVARDAARRGLRVALFEKEDYASGTTSRSTRLIHGGLRYLEQYDFALVAEAIKERRLLLRLAPHLVRPLPFIFPLYKGRSKPTGYVWSGMLLYDFLSLPRGVPHHQFLPADLCRRLEPHLREEGLRGGFLYHDGQCPYPERLCLETVLDAEAHGAHVKNHTRVVSLLREGERVAGVRVRDEITGIEEDVPARLVLNCAGPWADEVERLARPSSPPLLRRSKGVHLVVPRFNEHALIVETQESDRVVFAIPWGEHTLVGTTDTPYEGSSDEVRAEAEDVEYLVREFETALDVTIDRSQIRYTTAGLRPLPHTEDKTTAQITRRHVVLGAAERGGPEGYATVVGGKITSYRRIAQDIVDTVVETLDERTRPCDTAREPLPGGRVQPEWRRFQERALARGRAVGLDADCAAHLVEMYGAVAMELFALAASDPALRARITPSGPWVWAQVDHAVRNEHARSLTDVLLRRLTLGLSGDQGRPVAAAVGEFLAPRLGWDRAEQERQVQAYYDTLDRNWTKPYFETHT